MKQQHSSTTTSQSVSQSVSRSVTQSTSHPSSPPEHCNHLHKQHTTINHSNQSCIQMAGVRTDAVFPESVHEVIVRSAEPQYAAIAPPSCTNGSTTKSSTNQTNHTNDNPIQSTSTRASSSKWQCQRKGGAPNHSHINLPQTNARKVSNRIDDATRAKPRSEEGGARCTMK